MFDEIPCPEALISILDRQCLFMGGHLEVQRKHRINVHLQKIRNETNIRIVNEDSCPVSLNAPVTVVTINAVIRVCVSILFSLNLKKLINTISQAELFFHKPTIKL